VYSPAQVSHGYGFDRVTLPDGSFGDGTGQTIAIVDAFDATNIATDLSVFDQQWGLPDPSFTVAMPQGQPAYNSGWAGEISLDVEWAHAMAPGANILLVEALNNSYANLLGAVDYAAAQPGVVAVSMSWGSGEFSFETSSAYDGHFAGYTNLAFVASSGDRGAPPSWPAVSPNVVAVGGTRLNLDFQGNYLSESGWRGSGGGVSPYESQPAYQNGVVTQSSTQRTSPDVAYNADPNTGVYVRFNNSWWSFGGTSAGAPQWAALLAIADQGRAVVGSNPLGSQDTLNALYSLYNSADFNDVTTGASTGNPQYSAGPGYDLVTGIGTPNADLLINDLVNYRSGGGAGPIPGSGSRIMPAGPVNGPPLHPGSLLLQPVSAPVRSSAHSADALTLPRAALSVVTLAPAASETLPPGTRNVLAAILSGVTTPTAGTGPVVAGLEPFSPAAAYPADGGVIVEMEGMRLKGRTSGAGVVYVGDGLPAPNPLEAAFPVFEGDASSDDL
jgi:hypothetical protein